VIETVTAWLFVKDQANWPVHLIHVLEGLFIAASFLLAALVRWARRRQLTVLFDLISVLGGICSGVALIWPIALATFFFGARGESMMATLPLGLLALPFAIGGFIFSFRKIGS